METLQAIAKRQTIRDFSPEEIPDDVIRKIVLAGLQAPSNNHMREWEFVVLHDRTKRAALLDAVIHPLDEKGALRIINRWGLTDPLQRETYLEGIPKQYGMLMNAACLIIPAFRTQAPLLHPKTLSGLNSLASIWMCIENIFIAAADQGVFGVVRIPMEEERKIIKEKLNFPEGYEMPCYIALGYPAEEAKRLPQLEIDLEKKIHYDVW